MIVAVGRRWLLTLTNESVASSEPWFGFLDDRAHLPMPV